MFAPLRAASLYDVVCAPVLPSPRCPRSVAPELSAAARTKGFPPPTPPPPPSTPAAAVLGPLEPLAPLGVRCGFAVAPVALDRVPLWLLLLLLLLLLREGTTTFFFFAKNKNCNYKIKKKL